MSAKITFFPVANGDMTLITLNDNNETSIFIDVNIRCAADDPEEDTCDVASHLRKRLKTDDEGRPYVDVFVLSHPDQDHCRGLQKHFHLGKLDDYNYEPPEGEELKIVIREICSQKEPGCLARVVLRKVHEDRLVLLDARGTYPGL